MTDVPRVTVVVVSKDEPHLVETLGVLRQHIDQNQGECIVVDASRKRFDAVRRTHPWVRWVDFIGPFGVAITIAHQRNVGVHAARANIIAFCDSGGMPEEGWLSELTAPLRAGLADATCGPIYSLDSRFRGTINELPDGAPVRITVTANMAVLRSAFDAVGGFDERFAYCEDTEFGWRLQDARLRIVCAAKAKMSMHWGDVAQEVLRGKRNGQGTAMLFVTHPNRIAEQITMWPDLLAYPAWLIGLPISLALGAVSWWISVAWTCLLVLPAFRALRSETPGTFLRVKWVRSVSFFGGLISFVLDRRIRVLLVVSGHGVIRTTPSRELLAKCGIPTQGIDATKRCFGMRLLWCRLHGASIVDLRHADLLRDGRSDSHLVRGLRLARRVGIRVVAWDHEGDESAPRDVDTLIVSSRRRQEELVARSGRDRPAVVTIPHDWTAGAGGLGDNDAGTHLEAVWSLRRVYESLLGIEILPDRMSNG